ncbi:MAG: RHS repeat-associated core domain-containing protein, partial [Thermoanaerobaculia bacterium]
AVAALYGNGTRRQSTFDSRYRMLTNELHGAAGPLASYAYGYDAAGNVTALDDLLDRGYDRDYGYDDLGRLTRADGGAALWGPGVYGYDAMGNLVSATLGTARMATFTHVGTTPKLASVSENGTARSVAYDGAGNEVTVGVATYAYSPRNTLAEGEGASFSYDGRGVRTVTTRGASGRISLYTPELNLLAESEESSQPGRAIAYEYVWFAGQPLVQVEHATGAVAWYFDDHLGTPILQTDGSGAVVWRAEYEPYGSVFAWRTGANRHQPLRFPGQEADGGGLAYNIFRWYRSTWGRYTQADPIGFAGDIHLFRYAGNNPIGVIDPLGLKCCPKSITATRRPVVDPNSGKIAIGHQVCAEVGNSADCGVKQWIGRDLEIIGGRSEDQFRGPGYLIGIGSASLEEEDRLRNVRRTRNRICFDDLGVGFEGLRPAHFPLTFRGWVTATVFDRGGAGDGCCRKELGGSWSVEFTCRSLGDCSFGSEGRQP